MGCQVGLSRDLYGSDLHAKSTSGKSIPVGELYFDLSKLKAHLQSVGKVGKQGAKKLLRYVKYLIFGDIRKSIIT